MEQTQEIAPVSNEDGGSLAEPASGLAREGQMGWGHRLLYGSKAGPEEPKSWLEDDFVRLSSEGAPRQTSNAKQSEDADPVEQAKSQNGLSVDEFDQDAASPNTENHFQSKDRLNHESGDVLQGLNEGVGQKLVMQSLASNVHKRFGSEEPEPMEEEAATIGLQEDEQSAGRANGEHEDSSSDDDVPEVVGSKLISKGIRPVVKAPKRTKRKAKPSPLVNEQATPADAEAGTSEGDPFFVDSRPELVSNSTPNLPLTTPESQRNQTGTTARHQPPNKRKLFDGRERKPKDIIKDGVTYRTVSEPEPVVRALKRHGTSHLPSKSNMNSWRLRKQVLGRKRVQHVWGGRAAFLRSE
jgi:hypothetical protein